MASQRLPNYLRTFRKRSAFSQTEIGFLLGLEGGATVSRHEGFRRIPELETALAYEAILNTPVSKLFSGMFQRIERQVRARTKKLAGKKSISKADSRGLKQGSMAAPGFDQFK